MISTAIVLLVLTAYALGFSRYKMTSPAHVFAVMTILHLVSFYLTANLGLVPPPGSAERYSWRFANIAEYELYSAQVCLTLAIVSLIALAAELSGRIPGERQTGIRELRRDIVILDTQIAHILQNRTVRLAAYSLYSLLILAIFAHVLSGAFDRTIAPHPYRFAKSPAWVGINNFALATFHTQLVIIELICVVLLFFHVRARQLGLALLSIVVISYCAFLEITLSSRSQALVAVTFAVLCLLMMRSPLKWVIASLAGLTSLGLYQLALAGRRYGTAGLETLAHNTSNLSVSLTELFWQMGPMSFSGGTRIAYSFSRPVEFPLPYQILSVFSPLPTAIDGFERWKSFSAPINGNRWMPIGSYGEIVQFEPYVIVAAAFTLFIALFIFARASRRLSGAASLLLFVMTVIPIIGLPNYHLRGYGRMFLLMAWLCGAMLFILNRRASTKSNGPKPLPRRMA